MGCCAKTLKRQPLQKKQKQKERPVEHYEGKGGDLVALLQQLLAVALN